MSAVNDNNEYEEFDSVTTFLDENISHNREMDIQHSDDGPEFSAADENIPLVSGLHASHQHHSQNSQILEAMLSKSPIQVTESHSPNVRLHVANLKDYLGKIISYQLKNNMVNLVTFSKGEPPYLPVDQAVIQVYKSGDDKQDLFKINLAGDQLRDFVIPFLTNAARNPSEESESLTLKARAKEATLLFLHSHAHKFSNLNPNGEPLTFNEPVCTSTVIENDAETLENIILKQGSHQTPKCFHHISSPKTRLSDYLYAPELKPPKLRDNIISFL